MLPESMSKIHWYPALRALLAALLFGASAPLAKLLLRDVEPIPLAAFLYLGCGLGAALFLAYQRRSTSLAEARLTRSDAPWLAGAVLAGGVAAPIVLMFSLQATPAATASLLLNFEGVATALVAALAFREAVGARIWSAVGLVTLGSVLLSWNTTGDWGFSVGALGVLLACTLWGLDNNFTRNVSAKNPLAIVTIKGLCAGAISLLLALALRSSMPAFATAVKAMFLGSVSYGLSIVMFIMALRDLGAARTGALYGTAPFLGMLLAVLAFGERPGFLLLVSFPLMVAGAILLLGEVHGHAHSHEAIEHEHRHRHDDSHHTHAHQPGQFLDNDYHCHAHSHSGTTHEHPHTPDLHHRHDHAEASAQG